MPEFKIDPLIVQGLTTNARRDKFFMAVVDIDRIMNDPETKAWFIQQKFKQLGDLSHLNNEELWLRTQRTVQFNYSVIHRSWWKRWSSVIGYTLDNFKTKGPDIFTYGDSYDSMSIAGLTGHIAHELLHQPLGFSHSYEWNKDRDNSVPYLYGNYIENESRKIRSKK